MQNPRLYATFLLWLMSEMFEQLPEVGDPDKPKLVFFFDEAHLLFDEAPKALLEKIEQVVRLIRSKGVGVYFVTQNPLDVPETVLAQLDNRVQHALRAFTPHDQKAVKAAAETFRPESQDQHRAGHHPARQGRGAGLVSGGGGRAGDRGPHVDPAAFRAHRPGDAGRAPRDHFGEPGPRQYDTMIDRESAYEMLKKRAAQKTAEAAQKDSGGGLGGMLGGIFGGGSSRRMSTGEVVVKQVARSVAGQVGTQLGRALVRGILGSMRR